MKNSIFQLKYSFKQKSFKKFYCSLPKKMKCAVVSKHGNPFKIENVELPKPNKGELLVKIKASGCCHTDLVK